MNLRYNYKIKSRIVMIFKKTIRINNALIIKRFKLIKMNI